MWGIIMKTKFVIFIFPILVLFAAELFAATISITAEAAKDSADSIFKIVFTENNKTIAKRFYQNGKTVLSEGTIPEKIDQIVEARGLHDKNDFLQKIVFIKDGSIKGASIRQSDLSFKSTGEQPDGIIVEFDEFNRMRSIKTQINGKCQGPAIGFHKNGEVKALFQYKDNYPEGIIKRYYDNGKLMVEQKMSNRELIYHKEFDEKGNLKPPPISKLP
jgi:antitoxin component YwqK of YwqJK toxin-antitoxin module